LSTRRVFEDALLAEQRTRGCFGWRDWKRDRRESLENQSGFKRQSTCHFDTKHSNRYRISTYLKGSCKMKKINCSRTIPQQLSRREFLNLEVMRIETELGQQLPTSYSSSVLKRLSNRQIEELYDSFDERERWQRVRDEQMRQKYNRAYQRVYDRHRQIGC
jgi:hypothetical protein